MEHGNWKDQTGYTWTQITTVLWSTWGKMDSYFNRIASYIGEGTAGDLQLTKTMIDDWLTQGARDIINKLPSDKLWQVSAEKEITDSTGTKVTVNKILGVERSDGSNRYPCRKVPYYVFESIDDPNDIRYPMVGDPIFTLKNGYVKIKPTPSSSEKGYVNYITFPSIDSANNYVDTFPDDYEDIIITYAMAQAKIREAGYARRKAQDELEAITVSGYLSNFESALPGTAGLDGITLTGTNYANVTDALSKAQNLIDTGASIGGDAAAGTMSVQSRLSDEDIELAQSTLQAAAQEVNRANSELQKVQSHVGQYVSEMQTENVEFSAKLSKASSYLSEANIRLQTMNHFLQHSVSAFAEAEKLMAKYESDLKSSG